MTPFSNDPMSSISAEEMNTLRQSLAQMPQLAAHHLLPTALSAAVPLWIYETYQRGGPTTEDWARLGDIGHLLAERGDRLLYRSERDGETAGLFNKLAEALAILAFLPGGVTFGREHFDAHHLLSSLLGTERARLYLQHIHFPQPKEGEAMI